MRRCARGTIPSFIPAVDERKVAHAGALLGNRVPWYFGSYTATGPTNGIAVEALRANIGAFTGQDEFDVQHNFDTISKRFWFIASCPSGFDPALDYTSKLMVDGRFIQQFKMMTGWELLFTVCEHKFPGSPGTQGSPSDWYNYQQDHLLNLAKGLVDTVGGQPNNFAAAEIKAEVARQLLRENMNANVWHRELVARMKTGADWLRGTEIVAVEIAKIFGGDEKTVATFIENVSLVDIASCLGVLHTTIEDVIGTIKVVSNAEAGWLEIKASLSLLIESLETLRSDARELLLALGKDYSVDTLTEINGWIGQSLEDVDRVRNVLLRSNDQLVAYQVKTLAAKKTAQDKAAATAMEYSIALLIHMYCIDNSEGGVRLAGALLEFHSNPKALVTTLGGWLKILPVAFNLSNAAVNLYAWKQLGKFSHNNKLLILLVDDAQRTIKKFEGELKDAQKALNKGVSSVDYDLFRSPFRVSFGSVEEQLTVLIGELEKLKRTT